MFCEKCGTYMEDNDNFCPECGWKMSNSAEWMENPTETGTDVPETQPQASVNEEMPVQPEAPVNVEQPVQPQTPVNAESPVQPQAPMNAGQPVQPQPAAFQLPPQNFGGPLQSNAGVYETFSTNSAEGTELGKTKKKSKAKFVLIPVVILAVLAVCGFFFKDYVINFAMKTFAPADKYYQYVEKKEALELAENFATTYGTYTTMTSSEGNEIKGSIKLEIGEEALDMIEVYTAPYEAFGLDDLSWLSSSTIDCTIAQKDNKSYIDMSFSLGDAKILSYNLTMDYEAQMIYMQIPELTDAYLSFPLDNADMGEVSMMYANMDEMMAALPTQSEVNSLLAKYIVCVIESISDVDKDSSEIKAAGISHKYTELSYDLDTKLLADIMSNVYKEAKNDKELKKMVTKFMEAAGLDEYEDVDDLYDEFMEEFEDTVSMAKDSAKESKESLGEMTVWVNAKGEVVGRELTIDMSYESVKIAYLAPEEGNNVGLDFYVKSGSETLFRMKGEGKKASGLLTAEYNVIYEDYELLTISLDKFDTNAWEKGFCVGGITLKCGKGVSSMIDDQLYYNSSASMIAEMLEDYAIRFDMNMTEKQREYAVSVLKDKDMFVKMSVSASTSNGGKISIPEGNLVFDAEYAAEDYTRECDFNAMIKNLLKADLPEEIKEILEKFEDADIDEWEYIMEGIMEDFYYSTYEY